MLQPGTPEYKQARRKARTELAKAIRHGELADLRVAVISCVDCKVRRANVYDHRDYEKPLDVTAVCEYCNWRRGTTDNTETYDTVLPEFVCKRCGHNWIARTNNKPTRCPKCQSPYWDRERKQ